MTCTHAKVVGTVVAGRSGIVEVRRDDYIASCAYGSRDERATSQQQAAMIATADLAELYPCPHCAEDEKVLEERIGSVAAAVEVMARYAAKGAPQVVEAADALRDALRSLVREVRR